MRIKEDSIDCSLIQNGKWCSALPEYLDIKVHLGDKKGFIVFEHLYHFKIIRRKEWKLATLVFSAYLELSYKFLMNAVNLLERSKHTCTSREVCFYLNHDEFLHLSGLSCSRG